jgi:hypothetical protein
MVKTQVILTSNTQFEDITRDFDNVFGTTTYVAYLTLREIWDNFHIKSHPGARYHADDVPTYINNMMLKKAATLFDNKNVVYSNDEGLTGSMIGKLNSVYLMKQDILADRPFRDPISISAFVNEEFTIHPGGTRLMFTDVYHKAIPVMITDYTGTLQDDCPDIELLPYTEFNFSFKNVNLQYIKMMSSDKYCPTAYDKSLNPLLYDNKGFKTGEDTRVIQAVKEIRAKNSWDENLTYHKPLLVTPPRRFELTDNGDAIEVDHLEIMVKINKQWNIIF